VIRGRLCGNFHRVRRQENLPTFVKPEPWKKVAVRVKMGEKVTRRGAIKESPILMLHQEYHRLRQMSIGRSLHSPMVLRRDSGGFQPIFPFDVCRSEPTGPHASYRRARKVIRFSCAPPLGFAPRCCAFRDHSAVPAGLGAGL
jgi:hypothetical protein